MQLIGMLDSPYGRRVAIALIIAKTPFIHRPISLFRHIDQFSKLNPLLKAPTLLISLFRHIDQFSKLNPLLKAPTLITDDGAALMDSGVILDYLAGLDPRVAALTPSKAPQRLAAARTTGLALTVMEKAVQRRYERALRPAEKRHQPWVDRVMGQLTAGLGALDSELPGSGWIGGELCLADISVACAFGFTHGILADVVETSRYPNLGAFCARAEALPAFRAAPPEDGATASAIGD
jgi:glutathione S-transferase